MTSPAQVASAHILAQKISVLRVERIHPHPSNIREDLGDLTELANSIRRQGILQPLVVQPHPDRKGDYRLLAGHRRLAGAKKAGLDAVPAIVRHGVTDDTALELMLVENCQRRELNPVERAQALGALVNRGYSQAQIARQTGMSVSWVNYYLVLLDLDEESLEAVRSGKLAVGAAINAIRKTRRLERKKNGTDVDYRWEPDHFTDTHALARAAGRLCEARKHTLRRSIGGVACGQCWETAIRQDEQTVLRATLTTPEGDQ